MDFAAETNLLVEEGVVNGNTLQEKWQSYITNINKPNYSWMNSQLKAIDDTILGRVLDYPLCEGNSGKMAVGMAAYTLQKMGMSEKDINFEKLATIVNNFYQTY